MEKCICKICRNDGNKGTGFFCNINYENKYIPVMITNYHVINNKYIKENEKIVITINDDKENKTIELKNRIIYKNKEYDIIIIEIKENDGINNYMNIDKRYLNNNINIIYDKSIYIIQYPLGKKVGVSYGIINKINEYNIEYFCNTDSGSSGSPIINIINNEIIGIHKEGIKKRKVNRGTLLKYPIKDFINKIKNKEIEKEEIIKYIYLKDNNKYKIKKINLNEIKLDNNKDINKKNNEDDNKKNIIEGIIDIGIEDINKEIIIYNYKEDIDVYINNERLINKNKYKFNKKGKYNFKLIFKNKINNLNRLFENNNQLYSINIINLDTSKVIDMCFMFNKCKKLKEIKGINNFNTNNVTNMIAMFNECNELIYLDLSNFNSYNVNDMCGMFTKCVK